MIRLESILKKKRLLVLLPILVILAVLIISWLLQPNFFKNSGKFVQNLLLDNRFAKKSSAEVKVENQRLVIKFDITPQDQLALVAFSDKLGVGTDWVKGLTLEFDKETLFRMEAVTPTQLTLRIEDNSMSFSNRRVARLNSSEVFKEEVFATGSSVVKVRSQSDKRWEVKIDDLQDAFFYATASGKMNLSKKLGSLWFPIVGKVATIDLSVNGQEISGQIGLK